MDFFTSNFMLQAQNQPQDFHGVAHSQLGKRIQSMSVINTCLVDSYEDHRMNNNHGDDDNDEIQLGEKKRRLSIEQVRTLEKSFELGNKLEPERKMQLAKTLGLQPSQISIWFQNRRARSKTKQLERDYELLKRQFDAVKAENDALMDQNQKLHAEILTLKTGIELPTESINLNKDTEGSCSNRSENTSGIDIANKSTNFINSSLIEPSVNGGMPHIFQMNNSVISSRPGNISCSKNVITELNVKEESNLCNMFCNGMEDHTGFWPWLEQPSFN